MMSDLISRQAAIDAIAIYNIDSTSLINYRKIIRDLPSAQPERKTGRWIIRDNPGTGWYRITCSECGEDVTATAPCIGFFPNAKVNWDYCPNCGAKMDVQSIDDNVTDLPGEAYYNKNWKWR